MLMHFIVGSNRKILINTICNAQFSLLSNGLTNRSTSDNELVMIVGCDQNNTDEKIHTRIKFLPMDMPDSVTAEDQLQSLKHELMVLDICSLITLHVKELVGVGTDGA